MAMKGRFLIKWRGNVGSGRKDGRLLGTEYVKGKALTGTNEDSFERLKWSRHYSR